MTKTCTYLVDRMKQFSTWKENWQNILNITCAQLNINIVFVCIYADWQNIEYIDGIATFAVLFFCNRQSMLLLRISTHP